MGISCTYREVTQVVLDASRMLMRTPPQAREAQALIEPYLLCDRIDDAPQMKSRLAIALLRATAADCARVLGDFKAAAEWYRQVDADGGFPAYAGYYAKVVMEGDLRDHVASAAQAVLAQREWWSRKSMSYKAVCYGLWWLQYGLWRPAVRRDVKALKSYEDEVVARWQG